MSCLQKVVYTYVSLLFPALQQHLRSHCCDVKMKVVTRASKKKRLARKQKRRQRAKMQPLPREVRGEIDVYEREEQRLAKQRNA